MQSVLSYDPCDDDDGDDNDEGNHDDDDDDNGNICSGVLCAMRPSIRSLTVMIMMIMMKVMMMLMGKCMCRGTMYCA